SGIHSNGYSLVRRVVEVSGLSLNGPCPFGDARTFAETLLEPTRIYVRSCLAALRAVPDLKALAHITGGGLSENLPRVLPDRLGARIDPGSSSVPKVFQWIASTGPVGTLEMLRTFNCGIGMAVICARGDAAAITETFRANGETVYSIGE